MSNANKSPKILVIRRDNIGDLVCTTPLISALRQRFPDGWIGALVNSYNAPVLDGNTDLDQVFVYTKAKHQSKNETLIGILWRRYRMMRELRRMQIDDVIIATPGPQPRTVPLARWLKPKRVIGYGEIAGLDISLPLDDQNRHEVEDVFRIAALYGITAPPPRCKVVAPAVSPAPTFTIGVHISARKPSQRWPAERFAEVMSLLAAHRTVRFMLLWSPGAAYNPLHPGDDEKARAVMEQVGAGVTATPNVTNALPELIGALADCQLLLCADGGAMHLAAGIGLPIVCLFGDSGVQRWRPWGVPYRVLQKQTRNVQDISTEDVVAAVNELLDDIRVPNASALP